MTARPPGSATPERATDANQRRAALLIGPVAGAVLVGGTLLAAVLTAPGAWSERAFGDLGLGLHASLIVGSVLGVLFLWPVWESTDNAVQRGGVALFGIALVMMTLVNALAGAFADPPDVAGVLGVVGFMAGVPLAMLVYGVGDLVAGLRRRGLASLVLGAGYFGGHWYGSQAGELTALLGLGWLVLIAAWLLVQYLSLRP